MPWPQAVKNERVQAATPGGGYDIFRKRQMAAAIFIPTFLRPVDGTFGTRLISMRQIDPVARLLFPLLIHDAESVLSFDITAIDRVKSK